MRQLIGSALVQIMACRLVGAKLLSHPMLEYCQLDNWEKTSVNLLIVINTFSFKKMHSKMSSAKCRPFCPGVDELMGFWPQHELFQIDDDDNTLQWRHNERNGVSINQPRDCLLNHLFKRRSKKTPKLRVTDLCAGNSPVTGEFPVQRANGAENVSIWWRHHAWNFQVPVPCIYGGSNFVITMSWLYWAISSHSTDYSVALVSYEVICLYVI